MLIWALDIGEARVGICILQKIDTEKPGHFIPRQFASVPARHADRRQSARAYNADRYTHIDDVAVGENMPDILREWSEAEVRRADMMKRHNNARRVSVGK